MPETSAYGIAYKAKVVSRLPFLKNVIIESVERKKWRWLLKVLTSSIETEVTDMIWTDGETYKKQDPITYKETTITKEEADALIEEANTKYGSIMQAAWDYDILVYKVSKSDYSPEMVLKELTLISKSTTNNIVTPGAMY